MRKRRLSRPSRYAPEILHQIVRGHEVSGLSRLNRGFRDSHRQMCFSDSKWPHQDHVGSFMHEPKGAPFTDLPSFSIVSANYHPESR
jgi:hypothetical protein